VRALVAAVLAAGGLIASETLQAGDASALPGAGLQVRYGPSPSATMDVHRPGFRSALPLPGVLVVHGGGWRSGDKRRMDDTAAVLVRRGFVVFNVNYTLADRRHPGFARQLLELRAAVRWVRRHAARLGVDPARLGALGSSAGAHLAALLALSGRGPLDEGARVRAVVAWSGPFDLARLRTRALTPAVQTFLGCLPAACPRRAAAASPMAHVSPDDPDMLIVNSERELVPVDQAQRLAVRLASAGVPHRLWVLPGALHGRDYAPVALGGSVAFLTNRLR
jgi:acetyl esterase/lipase